jgi:hypothetical protein
LAQPAVAGQGQARALLGSLYRASPCNKAVAAGNSLASTTMSPVRLDDGLKIVMLPVRAMPLSGDLTTWAVEMEMLPPLLPGAPAGLIR